jgi:hypothetical protein
MIPRKQQQQAASNNGGTEAEGNGDVPTDRLGHGMAAGLDMKAALLVRAVLSKIQIRFEIFSECCWKNPYCCAEEMDTKQKNDFAEDEKEEESYGRV